MIRGASLALALAVTLALCISSSAAVLPSLANTSSDNLEVGQRGYAVPSETFFRSVAMQCNEFEIELTTRVAAESKSSFNDYVVYFSKDLPRSGLALEGELKAKNDEFIEFHILSTPGPWGEWVGKRPKLQKLRMTRSSAVEERLYTCVNLTVSGVDGAVAAATGKPSAVPVTFSLDPSKAFNWMRFGYYLDWITFMTNRIQTVQASDETFAGRPLLVDLGAGTGWKAILLKAQGLDYDILATDIAAEALDQVSANVQVNNLTIEVALGDLYEPVLQRSSQLPKFVILHPPQLEKDDGKDSDFLQPDVALYTPDGSPIYFLARFCKEAKLQQGGIAWLGVDWVNLLSVARVCCSLGWHVELPSLSQDSTGESNKGDGTSPSGLLELQKQDSLDKDLCFEEAKSSICASAEFCVRNMARGNEDCHDELPALAERGSIMAKEILGRSLLSNADENSAETYAEAEADADASFWLLEQDTLKEAEGVAYLQEAAIAGSSSATVFLGEHLLRSESPEEQNDGLDWILQAHEHGSMDATRNLVQLAKKYNRGLDVGKDTATALKLFEVASRNLPHGVASTVIKEQM
eukprot:TRINITY_DN6491_c0_g1_i1.p1 TRINITY_DN6491_c0_g1~~TRINITY_DN6491_c0_g1_i1.p1  ORF type:complete len:580 (-),score=101.96 TRINITY_DN6491_c0_g1_i1:236-1975(-)